MELMNQPFTGQLGDRLIDLLNSPDFHTLNIVVAFAKNSGAWLFDEKIPAKAVKFLRYKIKGVESADVNDLFDYTFSK